MTALRMIGGMLAAAIYQVATNPFTLAVVLVLPYALPFLPWGGHWQIAAGILGTFLLLCVVAVTFQVRRPSRLPGLEGVEIVTAPDWLFVFGDEQQGWLPQWLVDQWPSWAPRWLIALSCCAWRNKLRNLPFISWLAWLHKPHGELTTLRWEVRMRRRGWMVELELVGQKRFADFGPRLDQPDAWGGVSWAFRPWGRL